MGIVMAEIAFDGRAPDLSHIAAAVERLTGLTLSRTESGAAVKANLFDQHGYLDFASAPGSPLEVYTYRAAAVKELNDQTFGDARLPMAKHVKGLNEPPGTQTVYLRGYVGQEPTLFLATELALEGLGGRPRHPIPEEAGREYGRPITAGELKERRRKFKKRLWPAALISILLLPVAVPVCLAGIILTLPWRLWKANKVYGSLAETPRGSAVPGTSRRPKT